MPLEQWNGQKDFKWIQLKENKQGCIGYSA